MSKSDAEKLLDEVVEGIGRPLDRTPWDDRPGNVYEARRMIADADLDMTPGPIVFVGDLDSDEKGSGARMNADKLAVELIPVRIWAAILRGNRGLRDLELVTCVEDLALFQEGRLPGGQLLNNVPIEWLECAVYVFVYGMGKYKRWNWLKGMPWSVPLASAIRHAKAMFAGEDLDPESGLPHKGHFVCNLIMLATYYDTYKEGNDFPDPKFFRGEVKRCTP